MTILEYYQAHLSHVFGEEKANRIIGNAKEYVASTASTPDAEITSNPGEEENSTGTERDAATEEDWSKGLLPLIGLYRAMLCEGFTEREVSAYLKALWDIAPEEVINSAKNN